MTPAARLALSKLLNRPVVACPRCGGETWRGPYMLGYDCTGCRYVHVGRDHLHLTSFIEPRHVYLATLDRYAEAWRWLRDRGIV